MKLKRRDFLSHCSLCAAGTWLLGCGSDAGSHIELDSFDGDTTDPDSGGSDSAEDVAAEEAIAADSSVDSGEADVVETTDGGPAPGCDEILAGGTMLGLVAFDDEDIVLGQRLGAGWDGRRYLDLSAVPESLETPNELFYLRTFYPDLLDPSEQWQIAVDGLVAAELELTLDELMGGPAQPMGAHVLECSGNGRRGGFGLMSAAEWAGVPVMDVVARLGVLPEATRLLVEGFDEHSIPSQNGHSTPGASWIFTFDQLTDAGAFFGVAMNDALLPADNGAPVRLYVPGWYGCCCIKWVNHLRLVDDDEPATSQMREFASRTHQIGTPALARDYRPASMDQAAMPVRIERWLDADGAVAYRVLGIMWGGTRPTQALIFEDDHGVSEPVDVCPPQVQNQLWTVWQHLWRPSGSGRHALRMRIDDEGVPTRRLDRGYYERFVVIE